MAIENAIIVTDHTRLDRLKAQFNTMAQSQFVIEQKGADFDDYVKEHEQVQISTDNVLRTVSQDLNYKVLPREYISNFLFSEKDVVLVVGRDGLVANTAKYASNIPIIGINPDPERYDGVLLPFTFENFESALYKTIAGREESRLVTMAEAKLNDGQRLLAFNDFFIGPSSHVSARYLLRYKDYAEEQSSSGVIVSTGVGSTGWLSSLFNMANGMSDVFSSRNKKNSFNKSMTKAPEQTNSRRVSRSMDWEAEELVFVVREPFSSRYSSCEVAGGIITRNARLEIESIMPSGGVIFSDGIEDDYLQFNSGTVVDIGVAKEKVKLVVDK